MEKVFTDLELIFQGKAIESASNIVDFGSIAQGKSFRPECKRTICYIVCGVFFNEAGEVLMVQEAKASCRGKWYLPAGRVEPGENLLDAIKREVVEETGLHCEPTTLVLLENAMNSWHRFTFTGHITGGHLKTLDEADEESLEARWCSNVEDMELRNFDCISLIDVVSKYHQRLVKSRHPDILPAITPHKKLYMRFIIVSRKRTSEPSASSEPNSIHPSIKCANVTSKENHPANDRVQVLISTRDNAHLPLVEVTPYHSFLSIFKETITIIFGDIPSQKLHGAFSLEHCGIPMYEHDGFCLTLLVSIKSASEDTMPIVSTFVWLEISLELEDLLMGRLDNNMTIPIKVLQ